MSARHLDDEAAARALLGRLRETFDAGVTKPLAWRDRQLEGLAQLLEQGRRELAYALREDLAKPAAEAHATEIDLVAAEVRRLRHELPRLARAERVKVPLLQRPLRATVQRDPYGVALILAPWNFPVQLLLMPMAAALAAGNAVLASPSPLAPATAAVLCELVARHLDGRGVAVADPSAGLGAALVAAGPDYVFFTGSAATARSVMASAAANLVPVTLELGGKNPALVDHSADLEVAARRLAFGRFLNAGQSCVAPDYVLVESSVASGLVTALKGAIASFYGADPRQSADFGRIVNDEHFDRLLAMLEPSRDRIVVGGQSERSDRYLAPTVVSDPDAGSALMTEEIFGPVLPVVAVASLEAAVAQVRRAPRPLALYLFSSEREAVETVLAKTASGAFCLNAAVQHVAVPGLPFGGVGASGMGAYHGRFGYETFTYPRAVIERPSRPDTSLAYPPYGPLKRFLLRRAL